MDSASIVGFSDWYLWPGPALDKASQSPGVYVFRVKGSPCGRLLGHSDLIYIGTTTKQGLSGRLREHANQKDGRHWLKRIPNEVGKLEVAWLTLGTHDAARIKESDLLVQYAREHIELPPGNRQQSERDFQDVLYNFLNFSREEQKRIMRFLETLQGRSSGEAT